MKQIILLLLNSALFVAILVLQPIRDDITDLLFSDEFKRGWFWLLMLLITSFNLLNITLNYNG